MDIRDWVVRINDILRSFNFQDSPDIRVAHNPDGITFHLNNDGGSSSNDIEPSTFLCKITGVSGDGYTVDIYEDGYDSAATGSGFAQPLQILLFETLPVGTKVFCNSVNLTVTGNGSGV